MKCSFHILINSTRGNCSLELILSTKVKSNSITRMDAKKTIFLTLTNIYDLRIETINKVTEAFGQK